MNVNEFPPQLSDEETRTLVAAINNPLLTDSERQAARDRLITHNLRIVAKVVNRLTSHLSSREDAFQAGCVGLVEAATKVDPDRAGGWYTLATLEVTHHVSKWVREAGGQVKLSNRMGPRANQIRKTVARLEADGMPVTQEAVAANLGLTVAQVADLWGWVIQGGVVSLNHESDAGEAHEWVADDGVLPETEAVGVLEAMEYRLVLASLPARERAVLEASFGFAGEPQDSATIAAAHGVDVSEVARLLEAGLARMKHPSRLARIA